MTAVLPGQTEMFELTEEEKAWMNAPMGPPDPLSVTITAKMKKLPRQKCTVCGNRRVCFSINLSGIASSPPTCAKCAGLR